MADAVKTGIVFSLMLIMGPVDPQWYHWLLMAGLSIIVFFVGDRGPGSDGGAGGSGGGGGGC